MQNQEAPLSLWALALEQLAIAKINQKSHDNGYGGTSGQFVDPLKLYQDPRQCAQFNKYFKTEAKTILMQPGEFSEFPISMYTGKMSFEKYFQGTESMSVTKHNTYLFYRVYTDLTLNATASRTTMRCNELANHSINYEIKYNIRVAIPEQAGFVFTASTAEGTSQALTQRTERKAFDHYYRISSNGTDTIENAYLRQLRVDPINPISDTSG